jgi:small-conductance mechanosensitive channel
MKLPPSAPPGLSIGGLDNVVLSFLILFLTILVGLGFAFVLTSLLTRWSERFTFTTRELRLRVHHWKGPLLMLLPGVLAAVAISFLRFPGVILDVIKHLISLWIIAGVAWFLIKSNRMVMDLIMTHYQVDVKDNLRARRLNTELRVIERVITVAILLITVATMLLTFERVRQIGVSLLASAGVIGVILGFAAQRTLSTLFAGVQIAIAQPIRLDDVVIVEDEWGWIEEITLTYVVVRIWDLRRLIVPITYFIEHSFQNWTRTSADLLGTVFIYADYTLPVQEVRDELQRILESAPDWDKRVCSLQVTNASEHTIELRALMSAADSPTAWSLRCLVRERLLDFLQRQHPECLPRARVELQSDRGKSEDTKSGVSYAGAALASSTRSPGESEGR